MKKLILIFVALTVAVGALAQGSSLKFDINTRKLGAEIASTMYGIFFEDVDFAADGGLYAELVKNRSFEFPDHYMGWIIFGNIRLMNDGPFERNPHYVRLGYSGHDHKHSGLENEGFFGIGYDKDAEYRFSVWARVPEGGKGRIRVMLCDPYTQDAKQYFSRATVAIDSKEWEKYQVVIKSDKRVDKGSLCIMLEKESAVVDLEHISLFPVDTWQGHENGMCKDLAQALYDLKSGVFRFPGGCIVEGTDLKTRYQWKDTVGPVENLRPFVEQLRKRYPHIQIIGSSGPKPDDERFAHLWPKMREVGVDLVDEHFYRDEKWFLKEGTRYDNYDRKGPKVFAGEYACHGAGKKWNHFHASLLEAAFLTGVERNADIVPMATYAPLFAHIDGWQWRPDMIWYDNLRSFRSCSWYFHQIYAHNRGSHVLSLTWNGKHVAGMEGQQGIFASAVFEKSTDEVIVKIVNAGDKEPHITLNLNGLSKGVHAGTLTTYSADDLNGENSFECPTRYVPQNHEISVDGATFDVAIPAKSFAMYKIKK